MYHSMTLTVGGLTVNTWRTWHLIPTTRPVVNPPAVKRNLVSLPGTNSVIDLGKYPNNITTYENRTGSWEFAVDNRIKDTWDHIYHDILKRIHGLYAEQIILEDERPYYYQGYLNVNQWKSDPYYSTITIDYDLYPFKKSLRASDEPWLWDPFDFEYGYIDDIEEGYAKRLKHVKFTALLNGTSTIDNSWPVVCPIGDEPVIPNIVVNSGSDVYYAYDTKDSDYTGESSGGTLIVQKLKTGYNKNLSHCIIPSARDLEDGLVRTTSTLHFFGNGADISVEYHRGYL